MRMNTFAPSGANLSPHLKRNDKGRHGKFILILVISFRLSMMGRRLSWAFWRGLGRRM